jgi:hypothetical protein
MNAEATVTNRIHVFRASTEKDASAGTKAESAEEVASADVGTNLQCLDGEGCLRRY